MNIVDPSEQKIAIWKRIVIFLIDGVFCLSLYLGLLYTAGNASIKALNKEEITTINEIYIDLCDKENIPYVVEDLYGFIQVDSEIVIDQRIQEGDDIEKAYAYYQELVQKIDKEIVQYDAYKVAYSHFYSTYLISNILCMLIPLFIFELLIPLFSKKRQTLAMRFFSVGLVNKKTNKSILNYIVLFRFLIIFIVEYLLVYLFIKMIGLIFVILITFLSISLTPTRATLHDGTLGIKLLPKDKIYTD